VTGFLIFKIPGLFTIEETAELKADLLDAAKVDKIPETTESIMAYFLDRVRANLHVVICMSPVGEPFRAYLRMFPSLVNCTTIDWFSDWPEDALHEVAVKYLDDVDLESELMKKHLGSMFVTIHTSVLEASHKMRNELKRFNYVTPINYLELVNGYRDLLSEKRQSIGNSATKLRNGLSKLDDTKLSVEKISIELEASKKQVIQFQKQCEDYLVVIVQQKREGDEQAKGVAITAEKLGGMNLRYNNIIFRRRRRGEESGRRGPN
jgi:dynein heavy chain